MKFAHIAKRTSKTRPFAKMSLNIRLFAKRSFCYFACSDILALDVMTIRGRYHRRSYDMSNNESAQFKKYCNILAPLVHTDLLLAFLLTK